jgi:cytosol alanyl aminopeptidase
VRASLLEVIRHPATSREQDHAYGGLSAIHDPAVVKDLLPVLLEPGIDFKHGQKLLYAYAMDPRTQPVVEAFLRDNLDAVMARVPPEGATGGNAELAWVVTHACDSARRDEIERYVRTHFEKLEGGKRTVAQALESMDVCIAERAALRPELQQWLDAR